MSEHIESQKVEKKKRKKAPFFVVIILALSGFMLARGVVAASTDITLNGATALYGGEDLAATACDESITIRRTPVFTTSGTNANKFVINAINISDINQNVVGGCGNQILRFAVTLYGDRVQEATWSIPSSSVAGTFYFNQTSYQYGGDYYGSIPLTEFQVGRLSDTAYVVSIGSR
jgi:hypothetical protein